MSDERDELIEARAAQIYEATFWAETSNTASWAVALEHDLVARIESCRAQARLELEATP